MRGGGTDLVISEVVGDDKPPLGLCSSGHVAPTLFRREGPGTPALPTRFFTVVKRGVGVLGTFCEPCLIIANAMAVKERKARNAG